MTSENNTSSWTAPLPTVFLANHDQQRQQCIGANRCAAPSKTEASSQTADRKWRWPTRVYWLLFSTIIGLGMIWALFPAIHISKGSSQRTFEVEVDFDTFRKILVRKNATKAIVNHAGMQLADQQIDNLSIELPQQDRPILRALLGKANANLSATKEIVVILSDPNVDAKELVLTQHADISPEFMVVQTKSTKPAGNLKSFESRLTAKSMDGRTQVELSIEQSLEFRIPRIFALLSDRKVQEAAISATEDQELAIRNLIKDNDDSLFVLPDIKM